MERLVVESVEKSVIGMIGSSVVMVSLVVFVVFFRLIIESMLVIVVELIC